MDVWCELVQEWNQSIACVFFPEGSANFGKHSSRAGSESEGEVGCYCQLLYGEQKDWGCKWFEAWMVNVRASVEKGHTLRVYFFADEVGEGKIKDLALARWRQEGRWKRQDQP